MQGITLRRERRYVHSAARATAHRRISREAAKWNTSPDHSTKGESNVGTSISTCEHGARAGAALANPSGTNRRQ